MTTDATSGASAASSFVTDTMRQNTSQLLGALSQTTKFTFETLSAVVASFSKFPPSMPSLPLAPSRDTVKEWLNVGFETTEQLLKLQRELVTEMLSRVPVPKAR